MAKTGGRKARAHAKRVKALAMDKARAAGLTTGQSSRYAEKVARKRGGGAVDFRWMWWHDRGSRS